MQQLELFDYRKDYLFETSNQIAHYYDILKETEDTISYAEHIDPNQEFKQILFNVKFKDFKRLNKYINIKNHINELTFIDKNKRSIYGLYFQGGICKINKQSYDYITGIK